FCHIFAGRSLSATAHGKCVREACEWPLDHLCWRRLRCAETQETQGSSCYCGGPEVLRSSTRCAALEQAVGTSAVHRGWAFLLLEWMTANPNWWNTDSPQITSSVGG